MATPKKAGTPSLPSLGQSQLNLEAAARELRSAQRAFQAASIRLQNADEGHMVAMATLNADMMAVKSSTKVIPLHAQ